jgi:puromycin-sensitive aminopeptidase
VPSELVALSNMPIIEEKVDGHLKTVSYQESPIMSTYLVAVVVGLFDYVEDYTSDGKIIHSTSIVSCGSMTLVLDSVINPTSPYRGQSSSVLSGW